jgi:ketosteroid isomerase-like protein|tara:strand:- start:47 stop:511 length:465 start_codon:yes stop_codon:yes gene_type:complete
MINTKMMALWLASVMLLPSYVVAGHHETHEMSPKDVVAAAYATFAAGDTDAWAKLHTEDLTFTVLGQLPQSGVFIGTEAVIEGVFAKIPTLWPEFTLTPINIDVVGDTVYVHNKMTGEGLDSETMHMFTLRNGKIASFKAFEDTDSMRLAMKAQ